MRGILFESVRIHIVRCVIEHLDRRDGDMAIGSSKVAWMFCHLTVQQPLRINFVTVRQGLNVL